MPVVEKLITEFGVEPVCQELHIAPSSVYWQRQQGCLEKRSQRKQYDEQLCQKIKRIFDENHQLYGVRKIWHQLKREGIAVARCTVARLMKLMGIQGIVRGKGIKTTRRDKQSISIGDLVNRHFHANYPNQLWVADFTYVSTWQGFAYTAFIIDVFAGVIVGWQVGSNMATTLVLNALEKALWSRCPDKGVIHHSDRGTQYVSFTYTQRLHDAGVMASVGSVGDSYDNALAESINGLYKTEVIHRQSWKNRQEVELATLEWVYWYNHQRLLARIGYVPPIEAEQRYYASLKATTVAA